MGGDDDRVEGTACSATAERNGGKVDVVNLAGTC